MKHGIKIHRMVQYSTSWWSARAGHVTASNADRIITPTGKSSAQSQKYIAEIVGEQMTGVLPNFFSDRPMTPAMRHGRDTEPQARRWYQQYRPEVNVQMVGGIESSCGRLWTSVDGLVSDGGAIELKCPLPATQIEYLMAGVLPADYRPQTHFHLIIAGVPYVEFVSYCEQIDPLVVRVVADDYTQRCREALAEFLDKLEYTRRQLGLAPWPGTPGGPEPAAAEGVEEVHYDEDYPADGGPPEAA